MRALFALLWLPIAAATAAPQPPITPVPPSQVLAAHATRAQAVFAGGCFWCTESDFEKLPGVIAAESGYTGGPEKNPTYEQVSAHATGHTEAVRVTFDPTKVSYAALVEFFWRHIDPTVKNQQFCDKGAQYRSGIYPLNDEQMRIAQASKAALEKTGRFARIETEIVTAGTFWLAEAYHQDYYKTHALQYRYYRYSCGRDARLEALWGKP